MSNPQCPKCAGPLKDDYGMVECPGCGAYVFVDMDGLPHISTDQGNVLEEQKTDETPVFQISPQGEGQVLEGEATFELGDPPGNLNENIDSGPFGVVTPGASSEMEQAPDHQGLEISAERIEFSATDPIPPGDGQPVDSSLQGSGEAGPFADDVEFSMDAMLGFDPPPANENEVSQASSELEPRVEFGAPGDPLGINDFANSEISQGKDGFLTFRLVISGIDSKEMRQALREALEDHRFGWNTADLLTRITKGSLRIDNVPPVKAVILVNRIKRLPLKITWEQFAITQLDE